MMMMPSKKQRDDNDDYASDILNINSCSLDTRHLLNTFLNKCGGDQMNFALFHSTLASQCKKSGFGALLKEEPSVLFPSTFLFFSKSSRVLFF
jgi:hypothetical protein